MQRKVKLQSEDPFGCFLSIDNPANKKALESIADPNDLERSLIREENLQGCFTAHEAVVIARSFLFTDTKRSFSLEMASLLKFTEWRARIAYQWAWDTFKVDPIAIAHLARSPLGDLSSLSH